MSKVVYKRQRIKSVQRHTLKSTHRLICRDKLLPKNHLVEIKKFKLAQMQKLIIKLKFTQKPKQALKLNLTIETYI